jgi:ATP-dependent Lon protease
MEENSATTEIQKLAEKIKNSNLPNLLFEKVQGQIDRISLSLKYGGNLSQLEIVSKYIDWVISLPWESKTEDILEIKKVKEVMDKNHFGLEAVKKRILEYLSVLILQKQRLQLKSFRAPILLFVGLAGTGKTTFAKSIAEALGRKFVRIPFGGLSSALDLRGLSKVQPEAEPGQIIKVLRRAGVKNPVILLDELDRVAPEARGAIMGVLLELLDPEQNANFVDHYIDYPFDLSQTLFVTTANNTTNISTAVMDRLEVIQMPSYSDQEKTVIAKNYILPRLLKESGLSSENLLIEDVVWQKIARLSGYDPGIRSVERHVEVIVRKIAYKFVNGEGTNFVINEGNMKEYLE